MSDLEPTEVESRRAARERALELLYEAEAKEVPVGELLEQQPIAPAQLAVELLGRLVAPKWSLERLAAVDRSILRLGSYELLAVPERSAALVINEAVVLARRFGTDDSPRFVNGVLSSVSSEVRPAR
jgi:transcription antitermination protein NusB